MFTQLSLWFGIRYMLGNEQFNEYFGRAPFFITESVYKGIEDKKEPFYGNPLYSFLEEKKQVATPSVTVKYISNHPLYQWKHPGGSYPGENCIVIDNQYYIFEPKMEQTQGMTEASIRHLLRDAFNADQKPDVADYWSLNAALSEERHPGLFEHYNQRIEATEKLREKTIPEEEFSHVRQNPELELTFDLYKFSTWIQRMEKTMQFDNPIDYLPQAIDDSLLPPELLAAIPFENRTSMDFSKFKTESSEKKQLMRISQQFCKNIMACQSTIVILTGKAGTGKTPSAVCAAKELVTRGKRLIWISENTMNRWADEAESIADLDHCKQKIDALLASDLDVVFLDDDNLKGFSGQMLLEKIYSWFVSNPNKGLFITSNQPIQFRDCYRYNVNNASYDYPPFNHYDSPQYLNWYRKTDLRDPSLRSRRDGQSIGAIVSDAAFQTHQNSLGEFELIPGFDAKN